MPNWEEAIAGTDPNNEWSYLRITNLVRTVEGRTISWSSVTYREYGVEYGRQDTSLVSCSWAVATQGLVGTGVGMSYVDTGSEGQMGFHRVHVALDSDGDGMPDWWEVQYGLDTNSDDAAEDEDVDGHLNLAEYQNGSDPTNYWSVPLPRLQFLTVQGKYLVDEDTNRVVLKCVNIGGWLAFDQKLTGFAPTSFVSALGRPHTNVMDDATLRELLVDNVDFATNLIAVNCSAAADGLTTSEWETAESGAWKVECISGYGNGKWLCFSNVVFDGCVSNFSVILGKSTLASDHSIHVRLDNPTTGQHCGSLKTKDTGAHEDFSEQHGVLTNGLTGTQDVFFVPEDVQAVYRFRFYHDTNTTNLLETFRDGYFTSSDLDRIRELGYNCIRVPFLSTLVQDCTGTNYLQEGRNRLDWLISECTRHRIWCILDLHGAPGGQNWAADSGRAEGLRNRLWKSELYKNDLVHLWKTVAGWYETNSAVAGYDVFNEPEPFVAPGVWRTTVYSEDILPLLERVYGAIRSNDTNHVIFMDSNFRDMGPNFWNAIWSCPNPEEKGWTNIVYEFHHYDHTEAWTNDSDDIGFETQKAVADDIVRNYVRFSEDRKVPVFIGEFMPVEMPNFDYFIRQFEANGLSWAHWNYRHWGWDDSNRPWSSWGLDYRTNGVYGGVNTDIQPDVMAESFETLTNKLAGYTRTNYLANEHLCAVVANTTLNTNSARERTEFYVNTFSAQNAYSLSDPDAWPWRRVVGVGQADRFWIADGKARAYVNAGPLAMRFQSRPEADARFDVDDETGCWFSVAPKYFHVTNNLAGYDAAVRLCAVRDEITNTIYTYDSPGIIGVLEYDKTGDVLQVTVYAKTNGSSTYGTQRHQSSGIGFVAGAAFELYVNATSAAVRYHGTSVWSGTHGLELEAWPDGAVGVVEAEDLGPGRTLYVDLDDFGAERPDASRDESFSESFDAYPDGLSMRAESEYGNIRRWTNDYVESYVTNGSLFWIPQRISEGGSWYNPKREYQKDVRLNLTATNVIEFQVAFSDFSNGVARICLMPEYFPGEIYKQYVGTALYLQITNRADGHVVLDLFRHAGPAGNRVLEGSNRQFTYADGTNITWQISTNVCRLWYGTSEVVNEEDGNATNWVHDLTNAVGVYADGVYPHFEFLNDAAQTSATVRVDDLSIMLHSDFVAP